MATDIVFYVNLWYNRKMDKERKPKIPGFNENGPIVDTTSENVELFESLSHSNAFEALLKETSVEQRTDFRLPKGEVLALKASFLPQELQDLFWFNETATVTGLTVDLDKSQSGDENSWLQHIDFNVDDRHFKIIDDQTEGRTSSINYEDNQGDRKTAPITSGLSLDFIRSLLETAVLKTLPEAQLKPTGNVSSMLDERFFELLRKNPTYENASNLVMMLGASIYGTISEKTIVSILPNQDPDQSVVLELVTTETTQENTSRLNAYSSWEVTGKDTEIVGAIREVGGRAISGMVSHGVIREPSVDKSSMFLTLPIDDLGAPFGFMPTEHNKGQKLAAINKLATAIRHHIKPYEYLDKTI